MRGAFSPPQAVRVAMGGYAYALQGHRAAWELEPMSLLQAFFVNMLCVMAPGLWWGGVDAEACVAQLECWGLFFLAVNAVDWAFLEEGALFPTYALLYMAWHLWDASVQGGWVLHPWLLRALLLVYCFGLVPLAARGADWGGAMGSMLACDASAAAVRWTLSVYHGALAAAAPCSQ
jgi:hypothetical protein